MKKLDVTKLKKEQAKILRSKGMGYKKIAAITGLTKDVVRNAIKDVTPGPEDFTGFPNNSACRKLAERMIETAINSQFIRSKTTPVINDKYSFRVWLNTLGMRGKEYADARAELLKNLTGDTSYRTEEQRAAYNAKRGKPEPDFVVL